MTFTIGEKRLQANINTDSRMSAGTWIMCCLGSGFTHNQSVPMPISTQDKMCCFRCCLYWTVQLDLDRTSQLLGDDEMLPIRGKLKIRYVLPQLDRVPAVGLLETRETNTRESVLFGSKIAFERFREAICKHLHSGSRNVLTLPLESLFQIVLRGKRPILLIVCLDHLQHLVIDEARLCQARHEQTRLFL